MKKIMKLFILLFLLGIAVACLWVYKSWRDMKETPVTYVYENAYISAVSGSTVKITYNEKTEWLHLQGKLNHVEMGIYDVTMTEQHITKLAYKPETIQTKILSADDNGVELEGYERIKYSEKCQIYCVENGVKRASKSDVIVGFSNARFVVAKGRVHAVLIDKIPEEKKIRVLLRTNDGEGEEHSRVKVTSASDYTVYCGKAIVRKKKGQVHTVSGKERTRVVSDIGTVRVLTVRRNGKVRTYRGSLEIKKYSKGYVIINELPLEQYLYAVVPSEMPISYGTEALKVQAVCARSYGYEQIFANKLREYGAHVDDSVSFQVYNHTPEGPESRKAVDETRGQVLYSGDNIATTYFYSTSCGISGDARDVWYTKKQVPYLVNTVHNQNQEELDLSTSTAFWKFLKRKDFYDSWSPWFRWRTVISLDGITERLNEKLAIRSETVPSHIKVKQGKRFVSQKVETIGKVKKITIINRGKSGVVHTLEMEGEKATIRIYSEYEVRNMLLSPSVTVHRKDNRKVRGLELLPSAYFAIHQSKGKIQIYGGGYGHGVGMSQTGAKNMAERGMKYDAILNHYYPNTMIHSIT